MKSIPVTNHQEPLPENGVTATSAEKNASARKTTKKKPVSKKETAGKPIVAEDDHSWNPFPVVAIGQCH